MQAMPSIGSTFQAAVAAKDILGAAIVASSADGSFPTEFLTSAINLPLFLHNLPLLQSTGSYSYAKSFGVCSLKNGDASKPLELDAIYWMASCTKLMTAISALQCVERGQFTLDEDVTRLLPELKDIKIQTGFENGTDVPIFAKAKNKITLRYVPVYRC